MIRGLALTASFLLAGAVPAFSQSHPRTHTRPAHGQSGHTPLDSALHAAMHAGLLGSWKGTLISHHGVASGLNLAVVHDSLRKVTLKMSADQPIRAGTADNVVMDGDKLQWTQDLSGTACKATAVLSAATASVPAKLEGKMACENGESTFKLLKTTR